MPGSDGFLPGRGHRERRVKRISIFPLPGVVFFPGTLLPLHIFEPRYRALVQDALAGERLIGMALVAPDLTGPDSLAENPSVRAIGGAGRIVDHERLADGRFNIVLEGAFRFRILREEAPGPYRIALVEEAPSIGFVSAEQERVVRQEAIALFEVVRALVGIAPLPSESLDSERLSGEIALRLKLPTESLQLLLETDSLPARFDVLAERLNELKDVAELLGPYRPPSAEAGLN